jgi:hypothetical protein
MTQCTRLYNVYLGGEKSVDRCHGKRLLDILTAHA